MNINEHAEELKKEEQQVLDILITKMDKVIKNLDQRMQSYVEEARNTDISINPDSYLAKVLAQQGLKDTHENRKNFLQARDELYHTRLLLHYMFSCICVENCCRGIDPIDCSHNEFLSEMRCCRKIGTKRTPQR